ncbi:MAG: TraB/GumN family protein [Chitinophagales bacterium]|nr:TraB/GumN family protein [Chitinophagales bacterium]
MKNNTAFSLFLFLNLTCILLQQIQAAPPAIILDKPLNTNNSLLWQISGNGLSKPSYLYGTIHMISQDDFFIGKNVSKKIQKSEELIMELDLNNIDVAAVTKSSVLDSEKTIKNYMNDTDYNTLKTFMEDSIGIKKQTFELFYSRLKPFYLEQLIFFKYLGQEKESYEENFKKIAEKKNIPQSGLETFEEQLLFLEDIPLEVQLKSMIKTIKEYSSETQKLDNLIEDYKTQNLTALTQSFSEDEDPVWQEKLLDKRNNSWIPKLKTKMQSKACFIAVGAGHLGGENGLINLLKKQGYTVEPVSIN